MRKTLYTLGFLAIALVLFIFITHKKKEYVSLDDVYVVKYDSYKNEQNENAMRVIKDDKWGIVNVKNGEILLNIEYDFIDGFYNGLAVIKKDNKYGIIDSKLNVIVEPKWEYINPFYSYSYTTVTAKNEKAGVIDRKGNVIIKPLYYDYISAFNDELLALAKNIKDEKNVIIDIKGNVVRNAK